jgi:putative flippase GtrA
VKKKYIPILKQIIFFGLVGLVTLGIDVGVSAILFYSAHLPAYLASAIGFLSGFFFNFPMNRKRVFHHSAYDRFRLRTQVMMYILLSVFNLVTTSILVDIMVNAHIAPIQIAKLAVTVLIAIWNFVLFKALIFSKKEPVEEVKL